MRDKYYARFFDVKLNGELGLALGDRAVCIIDGRRSSHTLDAIAKDEAKKRGYAGVQMCYGTFSHPIRFGLIYDLRDVTDLQTVSERINATHGR